jgi:hypothetical protein
MSLNHTLYRILEGYLPPISWMRPLLWWHRSRFVRLKAEYDTLIDRWQNATDNNQEFPDVEQRRTSALRRKLLSRYPSSQSEVLPSRFGNIIRSFEVYPRQIYGVDSVPVWTRLASVIPKDFAGLLDDARAQVDCFVNLAYLASLVAIASLCRAAYEMDCQQMPTWRIFESLGCSHLVVSAAALVFAVSAYFWATVRVIAWGDLVKSAFDCYLPALMKQLGFEVPPTEAERQEFWREFSACITYQQPMTADRWRLAGEFDAVKVSDTLKRLPTTEVAGDRPADLASEGESAVVATSNDVKSEYRSSGRTEREACKVPDFEPSNTPV